MNDNEKGIALLARAQACHASLSTFRTERERNKRYNYGDQWSDIVEIDGRQITEEQYIKEQGSIPLKNNLIRRLVRNVVGVYSTKGQTPVCKAAKGTTPKTAETLTNLLHTNMHANRASALYARSIEEFLISGLVVHRKSFGAVNGQADCRTDYVHPTNFFVDQRMRDFRGWDCRCVGEMHDVTLSEIFSTFAETPNACETLAHHFGITTTTRWEDDPSLYRVTEIWVKEHKLTWHCHDYRDGKVYTLPANADPSAVRAENLRRRAKGESQITTRSESVDAWHYYFIAPDGYIIKEGQSPYWHGEHPYVFKVYPMIDGEVHSFVADVIDQQRYTNRLITLYDWIMRASSKGVLLVPDECVPRGCTPADFAEAWSRYNGVIFYKPSSQGETPRQVSGNHSDIGIKELLDVQLKFFEDISGVNEALQGRTSHAAMSAELFGRQTRNATTTLLDILDTFNEFVRDAAYKDLKNIQQYYSDSRIAQETGDATMISAIRKADFIIDTIEQDEENRTEKKTNTQSREAKN